MATRQPLYNEGSAVRTQPGQAQLASIPGRGVTIDSGALMAAVQAPQLDVQGAADVGRGYASFGRSISELGEPFLRLAEERARMYNANQVRQAQMELEMAQDAISAEQAQQPDEEQWPAITERIAAKARENIYKLNLPPAARDEVDAMVEGWNVRIGGATIVAQAKETRRKYEADLDAQYDVAAYDGDLGSMNSISKHKLDSGLTTPGQYALELKKNEDAAKAAQARKEAQAAEAEGNAVAGMAQARPLQEVMAHIDSLNLSDENKVRLKSAARGINRGAITDVADVIVNGILSAGVRNTDQGPVMEGIWNEQALESAMSGNPLLDEQFKEGMRSLFQKHRAAGIDLDQARKRENFGVMNYFDIQEQIENLSPSDDPTMDALAAAETIRWVKENVRDDLQNEVIANIKRKLTPEKDSGQDESTPEKIGRLRIKEAFIADLNRYSEIISPRDEKKVPTDDAKAKAQIARDALLVEMDKMNRQFEDFIHKNPDADAVSVQKFIIGALPEGRALSTVDSFKSGNILLGAPEAPPVKGGNKVDSIDRSAPRFDDQNIDLPTGGGPIEENPLLPEAPASAQDSMWVADSRNKATQVFAVTDEDTSRNGQVTAWDEQVGKFVSIKYSELEKGRHFIPR